MATNLVTYDQKGQKLSFANWISMISPEDTPFLSMTGKESINEVYFSWQTDMLAPVNKSNAQIEGFDVLGVTGNPAPVDPVNDPDATIMTTVNSGYTQILARNVSVSDTANVISAYGRGRELQYQMEKSARALKRDLESILLSAQVGAAGTATTPRKLAGFMAQVGDGTASYVDPDTGAKVFQQWTADPSTATSDQFETDLFNLTLQLYTAGAECDVIMIHPALAANMATLQEADGTRLRMFENTKQYIKQVNSITDPLGQTFKVVVNRWMPEGALYILNASDWTQMVLRAPKRVRLAKTGSAENWMIEMEVGLRHRNPNASGVLYGVKSSSLEVTANPSTIAVNAQSTLTASEKAAAKAAKA